MKNNSKLPTYYISHGGGPWPWMKKEMPFFEGLEKSLVEIPKHLSPSAPQAILMISAHWEEKEFTLMTSPKPKMLYDYSGFPPHTYQITYPAPGKPELALHVQGLIQRAGLAAKLDPERGFDHGAFVPLAVMYPEAQIPVVQLSLKVGLDPAEHLALGRSIASLRDEGVLVIGSGSSFHNLRAYFNPSESRAKSLRFDQWLNEKLLDPDYSNSKNRTLNILGWQDAPGARDSHPREEHLLPLIVALGAAEHEACKLIYREEKIMGGVTLSNFSFG